MKGVIKMEGINEQLDGLLMDYKDLNKRMEKISIELEDMKKTLKSLNTNKVKAETEEAD